MMPSATPVQNLPRRQFMMAAGVASLLGPIVGSPVWAAELAGVHIPDTYSIDGRTLVLNGYGLRSLTFLRIKLYVAALYVPVKTYDPAAILASPGPVVVVVHYLRNGTKEQVESRFREGAEENCGNGGCDMSQQAEFERLVAAAPPVAPGDTTAFVITDKNLRVSFSGRPMQTFGRGPLAKLMLAGFIGPHPPTVDLKANLLGLEKP
ncbi:MAG: chalcone isomerase family protein [Acetobacteraceae bacterium]|nr:chalcone isomerase family protein [Pseudomonadota bacterium]